MKLSKVYEPAQYESDIYALWEKSGAFEPKNRGNSENFSMVMPPPNANANIHIGTAITLDIEDIAVRYNRLRGKSTLFVPGADHAGFETQAVFEKQLAKQGKSRFDFSREELYQQIWNFVSDNKANYEVQFRKLGVSADWARYTFTLDEQIVQRAYKTFQKMWQDGLIYRGERLVNFCTFHGTAFADIEVVFKQEVGKLWEIRYPLTDGSGSIVVATTRPETMLGDTAVAVHPQDSRYKGFIGKTVKLPLTHREIPILADEFVDKEFGTGAVKITPAHDPNDYEVAKRHDLPMITVITHEGKLSHTMPKKYQHLSTAEARKQVVADLKEQGLLVKEADHPHSVAHCYKCDTVIEPLLREQWFVDMQPLAKKAIEALKAGKITFYPDSKRLQLIRYLEGLKDWNISRQIAWGIPIPAFQSVDDPEAWIYDEQVDKELITVKGKEYKRDPDVFDTWFSSSSWPYATLGYPDSPDFKQFYPLSVMETGGEILQPWVSRMIMLGLYITGEVPFKSVYIHGYVMAEDGSKMSKSVGNVIDPLPVIDEFGSDALRMGLIAGRVPAVNRGYDPAKIHGARNFCNKLWNVARFIEAKVGDNAHLRAKPASQTIVDDWVLTKLQQAIESVGKDLDNYRFAEAYDTVYHLLWDDFADWYIEASKGSANLSVLAYGLETILKLAHPFAPFVTETIWQTLAWEQGSLLMTSSWPEPPSANATKAVSFADLKDIISEIRYIDGILHLDQTTLYHGNEAFINEHAQLITELTKIKQVKAVKAGEGLRLNTPKYQCWLDIDLASLQAFSEELKSNIVEEEASIANLQKRLANQEYLKKAPKAIVAQTKDQLTLSQSKVAKMKQELSRFNKATT